MIDIDIALRLLEICCYVKAKSDIIKYILARYKKLKRERNKTRGLNLRQVRRGRTLKRVKKKLALLERRLKEITKKVTGQ